MLAAYIAITVLVAIAMASAAGLSFAGHESIKAAADIVQVPQSWMVRLGTLLAAGAIGLMAGFAVPALGAVAGAGLVLYFLGAVGAHLRVHDYDRGRLGNAVTFLALAVAALAIGLAYHGPW